MYGHDNRFTCTYNHQLYNTLFKLLLNVNNLDYYGYCCIKCSKVLEVIFGGHIPYTEVCEQKARLEVHSHISVERSLHRTWSVDFHHILAQVYCLGDVYLHA